MSNAEKRLTAFHARLEGLKTKPYHKLPTDIQHYFSQTDILSLVDTCQKILSNSSNPLIRVDKRDTRYQSYEIPRSFCVVCDEQGEYYLIVDTEYKKSNGDDDSQDKLYEGTFKFNHPAMRIDNQEPIEYLIQTVFGEYGQKSVENEIRFLKSFGQFSNLFCIPLATEKITLFEKPCYVLVTQRAKCDLYDLIEKESLTIEQKYSIAKQILVIIKQIHENHWLHQDIALRNFIVFEQENTYFVKLTDFGATRPQQLNDGKDTPFTFPPTLVYASPELILSSFTQLPAFTSDELILNQKKMLKSTISGLWLMSKNNRQALEADIQDMNIEHDMKNDVWACGLVIHRLFNGAETPPIIQPKDLSTEKSTATAPIESLIHAMLEPYRSKKITINEAFIRLEEIIHNLTYTK